MDLNHILNTDSSWKAARPSLPRPEQLAFTSSPHDLAIHQKTHRVNAYLIQPQSEHKRNDILYSLPSICSFDMPPPRLSDLYPVTYQYGLEQQNRSSSRYSGPQPSYLNDVQPITSSVPTAYASTYSRSSYKSLALSDLHIRPARGVFDPSFSFQEKHTDIHLGYQPAIVSGVSSMETTSRGQHASHPRVESTSSNHPSTKVGPEAEPIQLPETNAEQLPMSGPKKCTFLEDCSTESPERKVTSHFFGRNKKCTRQIPDTVWLWFCRKHYQRSRYRNRVRFSKLQLDAVRRQVERLEVWGGVTRWEIILKKSEKERLDKQNAELAKIALEGRVCASGDNTGHDDRHEEAGPTRPRAILEAEPSASLARKQSQSSGNNRDGRDDEDESYVERDEGSKKRKGGKNKKKKQKKKTEKELPPVCRWMVPYLGTEKTFDDVRVVLGAVHNYLEQTSFPFPNIEILPVYDDPKPPRRANQRRSDPPPSSLGKRKASQITSESSEMSPPTSRKRRSPAEDVSDGSGEISTASPPKRRSVAGGNTNPSNTMTLPNLPKGRTVAGGNTNVSNTMPSPTPPKRRTLIRGCKTPPAPVEARPVEARPVEARPVEARPVKQGKQAPKRGAGAGGGRR